MTHTPGFARSAGDWMLFGLFAGTMTVSTLVAYGVTGPSASSSATRAWALVVSAPIKTSAGEPCSIWVLRVDVAPVDVTSVVFGWSLFQAVERSGNVLASDDAASTVSCAG